MKFKATLLACGAVLLALHAPGATPLNITVDGKPHAEVVLDITSPQRQIEYAVTELTNWIAKISGAALPIVKAPGNLPVKLYLGTPDRTPAVAVFAKSCPDDFKKLEGRNGSRPFRRETRWSS